jgi:hypothetical protein
MLLIEFNERSLWIYIGVIETFVGSLVVIVNDPVAPGPCVVTTKMYLISDRRVTVNPKL